MAATSEMQKKPITTSFSLFLSVFFIVSVIILPTMAMKQNATIPVDVGVILDTDTLGGKKQMTSISMSLSDFYASHGDYQTRLVLNFRNSKEDVLEAAAAAVDLLKNVEVQAIIGPVSSMQAEFVINLGKKSHVPIISYSATNPSLSSLRSPYFIRTTPSDSSQVKAISSIVDRFGWRAVVPIHVDNEFGEGIIPFLTDTLDKINTRVPYRCVISPFATDEEIQAELQNLTKMSTRVFLVHMLPELGSRLFAKAHLLGMLSKGYAWIITDAMTNQLNHSDIDSMLGVIGVKPYVPRSKELENFRDKWKLKFHENNSGISNPQLDMFDFWAYDSTTALAMAVEKAKVENMAFQRPNNSGNTDLDTIGVSENGPKLLEAMLSTRFKGLSGDFHIVDGQLQPPAYQIENIIGKGERVIGFWTVKSGIVRQPTNSTNSDIGAIIWPGDTGKPPKGWGITTKGERIKIGVPVKDGFNEFVRVTRNSTSNTSNVTGYCIDVFKAVVKQLGYPIHYDFIPFANNSDGKSLGTYDDLIHNVYERKYDAVVGDVTIIANRTNYVDFSLPFTESGVSMVVPTKDKKVRSAWVFLKPLTWDLWLTSFFSFIAIGLVIWFLEHRVNDEFSGPPSHQIGMMFWFAFSTMVFVQREKIVSNLARFVLIIWFLVVLILTQSYTASLSSMLTLQQLEPTISDVNELIKNNDSVGYQKDSFVQDLLKQMHFDDSRILPFSTPEECNELLERGSKNGGIAAAFDEVPYMKLFLAKYCSKYTMVQPTYKTDGFGFVFQKGSPLVVDVSRAVLTVTEDHKKMEGIENKWFKRASKCPDSSTSNSSTSLDAGNFGGLFLLVGVAFVSVLIIYAGTFLREHWHVLTNPNSTKREKTVELAKLFVNKDLSCSIWKKTQLQIGPNTNGADSPCTNCLRTAPTFSVQTPLLTNAPPSPSLSSHTETPLLETAGSDQQNNSTDEITVPVLN